MTEPSERTDDVAGTPEDRPVPTGGRAERAVPQTHAEVSDALLEVDDVTLREFVPSTTIVVPVM